MTGTETRNDAYFDHRSSGKLGSQQRRVLDEIRAHGPGSRSELAERTGLRLSAICGRTAELMAAGLLSEYTTRPCAVTGRTVTPVGVPVPVQSVLDLTMAQADALIRRFGADLTISPTKESP